jgi:hypothetical protein
MLLHNTCANLRFQFAHNLPAKSVDRALAGKSQQRHDLEPQSP